MKLKKVLLIILGTIGLGLGALGAALPLLPAFPFLLIAAICYSKSSERLDKWFKSTKLYKNNLESFVKGEGMSVKTKHKVMFIVTILMCIGFFMMKDIFWGQIVLVNVWLFHMIFFSVMVKNQEKPFIYHELRVS